MMVGWKMKMGFIESCLLSRYSLAMQELLLMLFYQVLLLIEPMKNNACDDVPRLPIEAPGQARLHSWPITVNNENDMDQLVP